MDHLKNMAGGAPGGVFEELYGYIEFAESYDELWQSLRDGYNDIAERYMNMENGGVGGRPMPEMDRLGEAIKEVYPEFVGQYIPALQELA